MVHHHQHQQQPSLPDLLLNFIKSMAPNPLLPSSAKITPMSWLSYLPLGSLAVSLPLNYHVLHEILEHMLFNIVHTYVLAPSTKPASVLQKFIKGKNFSSNFSMSATDKSIIDLSLPCLPFDLKDTLIRHLSYFPFPCSCSGRHCIIPSHIFHFYHFQH